MIFLQPNHGSITLYYRFSYVSERSNFSDPKK